MNRDGEWVYVARSEEVAPGSVIAAEAAGERLVLFRTDEGALAALRDRCPHRFAPLSLGAVRGASVQCIYHGLHFGTDGVCSHNPHGEIPPQARVASFPVRERNGEICVDLSASTG